MSKDIKNSSEKAVDSYLDELLKEDGELAELDSANEKNNTKSDFDDEELSKLFENEKKEEIEDEIFSKTENSSDKDFDLDDLLNEDNEKKEDSSDDLNLDELFVEDTEKNESQVNLNDEKEELDIDSLLNDDENENEKEELDIDSLLNDDENENENEKEELDIDSLLNDDNEKEVDVDSLLADNEKEEVDIDSLLNDDNEKEKEEEVDIDSLLGDEIKNNSDKKIENDDIDALFNDDNDLDELLGTSNKKEEKNNDDEIDLDNLLDENTNKDEISNMENHVAGIISSGTHKTNNLEEDLDQLLSNEEITEIYKVVNENSEEYDDGDLDDLTVDGVDDKIIDDLSDEENLEKESEEGYDSVEDALNDLLSEEEIESNKKENEDDSIEDALNDLLSEEEIESNKKENEDDSIEDALNDLLNDQSEAKKESVINDPENTVDFYSNDFLNDILDENSKSDINKNEHQDNDGDKETNIFEKSDKGLLPEHIFNGGEEELNKLDEILEKEEELINKKSENNEKTMKNNLILTEEEKEKEKEKEKENNKVTKEASKMSTVKAVLAASIIMALGTTFNIYYISQNNANIESKLSEINKKYDSELKNKDNNNNSVSEKIKTVSGSIEKLEKDSLENKQIIIQTLKASEKVLDISNAVSESHDKLNSYVYGDLNKEILSNVKEQIMNDVKEEFKKEAVSEAVALIETNVTNKMREEVFAEIDKLKRESMKDKMIDLSTIEDRLGAILSNQNEQEKRMMKIEKESGVQKETLNKINVKVNDLEKYDEKSVLELLDVKKQLEEPDSIEITKKKTNSTSKNDEKPLINVVGIVEGVAYILPEGEVSYDKTQPYKQNDFLEGYGRILKVTKDNILTEKGYVNKK